MISKPLKPLGIIIAVIFEIFKGGEEDLNWAARNHFLHSELFLNYISTEFCISDILTNQT